MTDEANRKCLICGITLEDYDTTPCTHRDCPIIQDPNAEPLDPMRHVEFPFAENH